MLLCVLLSIPSHTLHRLQSLDVGVCYQYTDVNSSGTKHLTEVSHLLGEAYGRAVKNFERSVVNT